MKEIWKQIPGYKYYHVSNMGNVRSIGRYLNCESKLKNPHKRFEKGIMLKQSKNIDGYYIVGLSNESGQRIYRVSRLVLLAFMCKQPIGMECCHNNGIKTDNRLENLRWDTPISNAADAKKHGKTCFGDKNGNSKANREKRKSILESEAKC